MKFSVIIPVYNVETYLQECLESILAQTYQNYEVLLINDGSTDASGEICDRYAEQDSRITVYHQANKGVSTARNRGLQHATGEWICFVDSDDLVDPSYLGVFAKNISDDSDLLIQGSKRIGKVNDVFCSFEGVIKISKYAFFDHYAIWPHYFSAWGKAFKRRIIVQQNLRFDESIHYAEDTLFNLDYAAGMHRKFTLLPDITYTYRFNFEGLAVREVGFYKRRDLLDNVHQKLQKLTLNRRDLYPYCVLFLKTLYLDLSVVDTYKQLKLFLKSYKPEVLQIYKEENLSMKIITQFIKYDCYYILDKIFKSVYKKEIKF